MKPTSFKHVCITCKTYEVNPMISSIEGGSGKSFCSRICQDLWLRYDETLFLSMKALQRIALKKLSELVNRNEVN